MLLHCCLLAAITLKPSEHSPTTQLSCIIACSDGARFALFHATHKELRQVSLMVSEDQADVRGEFGDQYTRQALASNDLLWFTTSAGPLLGNATAVGWANDVCSGECLHPELCFWKVGGPLAMVKARRREVVLLN
jgi:hypothetical protein